MSTTALHRREPLVGLESAVGFGLVLGLSLLPMAGLHLWMVLTDYSRWAYSDLIVACTILGIAGWMLSRRFGGRVELYLVLTAGLVVAAGECYHVFTALDAPLEDDYLSSATSVLGFMTLLVLSVVGLASSLRRAVDRSGYSRETPSQPVLGAFSPK